MEPRSMKDALLARLNVTQLSDVIANTLDNRCMRKENGPFEIYRGPKDWSPITMRCNGAVIKKDASFVSRNFFGDFTSQCIPHVLSKVQKLYRLSFNCYLIS